ncbi:thiamine biosynthesis protein ThiF [Sulfurimonas sp.]
MMDGFDLSASLVCEGIVGDGCGGGRIFFVENEKLQVYDPITKEKILLLQNVKEALSVTKKGCVITVTCKDKNILFDLSTLN